MTRLVVVLKSHLAVRFDALAFQSVTFW